MSRCRRFGQDLRFSETSLVWVVNAYMLTFGGFLLLGGRLGDLYGHRRLFLIGHRAVHGRLAGVRARAARRVLLIAARAVQGLGGAVVTAVALSLIMDLFAGAGRPREGDGHLRLRVRRRRQHRRAARRLLTARSTGTGSSWSICRSASSCTRFACAACRGAQRKRGRRAGCRRRGDRHALR